MSPERTMARATKAWNNRAGAEELIFLNIRTTSGILKRWVPRRGHIREDPNGGILEN
jgi:hypothetical protein